MKLTSGLLLLLLFPAPGYADCSGGAIPVGAPCGKVGFSGCCDDETLYFCEGNELCARDCSELQHCGWNGDKGFYDCQTAGMSDPSGGAKECPVDACQGVAYAGCCAGARVYWCSGGSLKNLDCGENGSLTACGLNEEKGAIDCVMPESPSGPVCPFEAQGDILVPADIHVQPDLNMSTDNIAVPDLDSPSQCFAAAGAYLVESSDCGVFADSFVTKQEGCVVVYVGLVPGATTHPAGAAGKSGFGFAFTDAGITRQCQGQKTADALEGQCQWSQEQCTFRFLPAPEPQPVEPAEKKKSGGCSASGPAAGSGSQIALLLILLGVTCALRANRG